MISNFVLSFAHTLRCDVTGPVEWTRDVSTDRAMSKQIIWNLPSLASPTQYSLLSGAWNYFIHLLFVRSWTMSGNVAKALNAIMNLNKSDYRSTSDAGRDIKTRLVRQRSVEKTHSNWIKFNACENITFVLALSARHHIVIMQAFRRRFV